MTKGHAYRRSQLRAKYPSIINVIDKDQHRRKRKFIGQVLTERSMRTFEPTMGAQIDIFLRLLLASSRNGSPVNMTERCQRLGVDVVGLLAFGYPLTTQTGDDFRFLPPVIDAMSWRISTYMQFSPFARLEHIFSWLGKGHVIKFGNAVQAMIKTRMAQDKNAHHDLFSVVADYIGKGQEGLYEGELWPEAILFIMAGMLFPLSLIATILHSYSLIINSTLSAIAWVITSIWLKRMFPKRWCDDCSGHECLLLLPLSEPRLL